MLKRRLIEHIEFPSKKSAVLGFTPLFIMGVVLVFVAQWLHANNLSSNVLFREPGFPPEPSYIGFFSHFGNALWFVGASIAGFCGFIAWQMDKQDQLSKYLMTMALGGFTLGVDDVYSVHDYIAYHDFKIPGWMFVFIYGFLALLIIILFRRQLHHEFVFVFTFVMLFVIAQVLDLALFLPQNWHTRLIEEYAELLGTLAYVVFCIRLSYSTVINHVIIKRPVENSNLTRNLKT